MSKNVIIGALVIVITILIGVLILTNYNWFSDEWLIGLGMVLGGIGGAGIFIFIKLKR